MTSTPASRATEEMLNTKHLACEHGEDWVTDGHILRALMADGNLCIPSHYAEAMQCPNLWEELM